LAQERLQKLIAAAGVASRRKAEGLIEAGRVEVNGQRVTDLGSRADPERDEIRVDGEPIRRERRVWIALHKPAGVVSSVSDPHADRVVTDLVDDVEERVYPAGRLDLDSEGLVLMTHDGELMHAMTRPGGPIDKVYRVTVKGRPREADLDRLRAGIELAGQRLLPSEIEPTGGRKDTFRVVLHEGKNNQIRRMFASIGHPVRRLVRTRIGPLRLEGLPAGASRGLTVDEVGELRSRAGLDPEPS